MKKGDSYVVDHCRDSGDSVAAGDGEQLHDGRFRSPPSGAGHHRGAHQCISGATSDLVIRLPPCSQRSRRPAESRRRPSRRRVSITRHPVEKTKKGDSMNFQPYIRNRIGPLTAILLVAGLFGCAQSPSSQELGPRPAVPRFSSPPSAPAVVRVTVAGGTQIHMTLSTSIDSETSQAGDS